MQPSTTPIQIAENAACTDCEQPLQPGQKLRCLLCVKAAEQAVREARGATVTPSLIARIRERLGS